MKYSKTAHTSVPPEEAGRYVLWKDVSFFGCIISGLLLAVVVFKLFSPEDGILKVQEVIRIKWQLEHEIAQLEQENARIDAAIKAMQTDPFQKEKIAREELNMALPDEIIYKFTE